MEPIQVALVPEILVSSQFLIDTLCLEDDADLTPHTTGFFRRIMPHHERASGIRDHQRGKDAEERCLATAVWSKQSE